VGSDPGEYSQSSPHQRHLTTQGAPYFNQEFGSLTITDPITGVVGTRLSGSEQSAGTGLGTAGIMLGCMVRNRVNFIELLADLKDCPMVQYVTE